MNTILTINLTGSVLLVLYFLVKHFLEERLTKKFLYRILQVNVVCFLVPLMLIGDIYRGLWLDFKALFMNRDTFIRLRVTPRTPMFLEMEEKINLSLGMRGKMLLTGGYLFLVLLCLVVSVVRDCMKKRPVQRAIRFSGVSVTPDLAELQKEMKIRKKVSICLCGSAAQISTIGFIHPIIFFKDPEDDTERKMLLSHELYHIKGHDIFWKWCAILVKCIHFYNPFAYLLLRELEEMQELYCDEQVTSGRDIEERGLYANLLLKNSGIDTEDFGFRVLFGETGSYKRLYERTKWVMKNDQKKKMSKYLTALVMVLVLGTTSFTTLAYDEMRLWDMDEENAGAWDQDASTSQTRTTAFSFTKGDGNASNKDYPILYEKEYIDEEGNVHPLETGDSTNAFCLFHIYQDCVVVEHYLNIPTNSCEVWYYDAEMCIKCSHSKTKVLTDINKYPVCPHGDL